MTKKFTDEELVSEVQQELNRSRYLRFAFERDWYGNLLFRQGHQWIVWDETGRRFRQKKLKPWIPQPVSNRYASVLGALEALLLRVEPVMQWRSADQNNETLKSVAETSTQLLDRIKEQTYFQFFRQTLASWLTYSGNAYLVNYYDEAGGIPINVPLYKCKQCEAVDLPTGFQDGCAKCGHREYGYDVDPATGVPREMSFTGGSIRSEVGTPFEVFYDFSVTEWHRQPYVFRVKDRSLDYFRRYGARGAKVQHGGASTLGEFYSSALAYMASGPGINPAAGQVVRREGNAEISYYRRPDDRYPDGLFAIIGGDQLLVKEESLPKDHKGERFIPVTQFLFDPIPGSAVGKTVASDLRPKQKQRNELESLIQLITMRMANPVWIIPYGTDVEGFSGQPGAVLKAIQLAPNVNSNPQRLPGENVPSSVMAWLDKIDQDMEEIACLTGDQAIPCLDGQMRTMRQLSDEYPNGGVWVYGFDTQQMRVVPTKVRKAWRTAIKSCVRVQFKEGTSIDCTTDHLFLTWDRGYIRADELRHDDSIVPLILHSSKFGYLSVAQPVDRRDDPVHRMVAYALLGLKRGQSKLDVHHKNGDVQDNDPDNLEVLTRREHILRLPPEKRSKLRHPWTPESKAKLSASLKLRWQSWSTGQRQHHVARMVRGVCKHPDAVKKWTGRLNHRVLSVVAIGSCEVFDLQTDSHNFGTAAGVFVHNSVFEVLKGQAPTGITAGYALRLLTERGQSRWGPLFQRWENGFVMWATQVTAFAKEWMPADQILELLGDHADWEVRKFKEESTAGLNLRVEAGSNRPQSALTEQAMVDQFISQGIIDHTDPNNKAEILRTAGLSKYDQLSDWDMKDAAREEEAFYKIALEYNLGQFVQAAEQAVQAGNPEAMQLQQEAQMLAQSGVRFRETVDNHQIHLWAHKRFAKTDRFFKLSAEWQAVWLKHSEQHAMRLMQEAQQTAMMSAAAPMKPNPSMNGKPPAKQPENLAATPDGGHIANPASMGAAA